ncbi:MAG TPA: hypothetical protein VGT99_08110 [Gammaproteobacteria bacterium]|nr:hypothetical protein [Gammaproteobacteria bacterium]
MEFIDTGPMLLGMLLTGAVIVSIPLHLSIKRRWLAGVLGASITVIAIFILDCISVGFFNEQLLLGVAPGWVISFVISYLVWGVFWVVRKK